MVGGIHTIQLVTYPPSLQAEANRDAGKNGESSTVSSSGYPCFLPWFSLTFSVPLTKNSRSFATKKIGGMLVSVPLFSLLEAAYSLRMEKPWPSLSCSLCSLIPVSPSKNINLALLAWITVITH